MPTTGTTIRSFIMGASTSHHQTKSSRTANDASPGSAGFLSPHDGDAQVYATDPDRVKTLIGQPFKVLNIEVKIDKKPTQIDESSQTVLKYKTPHYRATATVQVPPLKKNEKWQIGWIQACTFMRFVNTYGNEGCSSWEFPELTNGQYQMISDSDGRHYPWYGNKGVVATVQGPTRIYQTICVGMTDNFYPHITWVIPIEGERRPKLTHIVRHQTFYTWLVARNITRNTYHVLKTTTWTFWLEIHVNPDRPLGQRARLVGNWEQVEPHILDDNVPIDANAMKPPNANSAQILVWRPAKGNPRIIIPPKWRHPGDDRDLLNPPTRSASPRRRTPSQARATATHQATGNARSPSRSPHRHHHRNWGNNGEHTTEEEGGVGSDLVQRLDNMNMCVATPRVSSRTGTDRSIFNWMDNGTAPK